MNHDLTPTPYRDMVEGPLPLEATEHALNGLTLPVEGLELRSGLETGILGDEALMTPVELDHRSRAVLALHQVDEVLAGVPRIGHDVAGPESLIASAGVPECVGRPLAVVDIPCADVNTDGQLVFAISHQVQFVTVGNLLGALCADLDRPPRFSVGLRLPGPVTPSLERCRVHRHPVTKAREFGVVLSHKRAGDFPKQREVVATGELGKEPAECSLMGYVLRRVNTTGPGHEGVVSQCPYQSGGRGQAHVVFGQEAVPEGADGMTFGATPGWALQCGQQVGVVEASKEVLEFLNERRSLYSCISECIIAMHDGRPRPSCRSGDSSVGSTWVSVFIGTIVLNCPRRVNGKSRMNRTNLGPILCAISLSYSLWESCVYTRNPERRNSSR